MTARSRQIAISISPGSQKQATKKQATDFTDFHRYLGLSIRDDPRQSVAKLL
jgi:hypothetical protein